MADPDILLATDPSWPDGGEFRGIEEYERFMGQFLEAFEGIQFKEESAPEAIGGVALFHGRWVGLGAASGIETASAPFWVLVKARAGKIAEARFYFDEEAARGAATAS
jgi:hypothetical protein